LAFETSTAGDSPKQFAFGVVQAAAVDVIDYPFSR
jgi:hypothetical protein